MMRLLTAGLTHSSSTAGKPISVGLVKWVSALAMSLTGHIVRSVGNAIALIIAIGADLQVVRSVMRTVSVRPMSDLHTLARPFERGVDQPVYELSDRFAVTVNQNSPIPLLVKRAEYAALPVIRSAPFGRHGAFFGSNTPLVRRLIQRELRYWPPCLIHLNNNTCIGGE